jgi:prolyl-tRNA synthetase
MLRAKNRMGGDLVISPTAEEGCTDLIRHEMSSYRQFPLVLYQINTKYRDEIRPRYGVIRGREFTMFDAYSYDIDEAGLHKSYKDQEQAYRNIFKRCGLEVLLVGADSGAIGGSFSEEFMVESDIGDNTLILCKACDYAANVEKAACKKDYAPAPANLATEKPAIEKPAIEKIDTPAVRTIDELCVFL